MKRVFHIVSNNWTSGLEKVVMNICTLVPGYDFTYVVPHGSIEDDLKKKKINYIALDKLTPLSVRKIIEKYHPNILHAHDIKASLCVSVNHSLCKEKGIRVISELHNDDIRMHKYSIRSVIYNISSYAYDDIVTVSKEVFDNYIFKNKISNKVSVIENVIDPDISKQADDSVKSFDFLFLGRLEYQKNPEKFVEFIKKVKETNSNVSALIIGKGSLKNNIESLIKDYGLRNNIKLLGYQNNPYSYINKAKAVVITSRYEGLCLVALESLMLGKPIISVDVGGVNQLIDSSCGIKSDNLKDLVKYGNKIMNDSSFCKTVSKHAYEKSKAVNNVDKFIASYQHLYG